jgi:formate hydrogenlyase subunit 3/multisubunit Na+/H+ antiporter MnhD subunit
LELGAFMTVALVWQCARTRTAKLTYLTVVLLSALPLVGDLTGADQFWTWAFLLTSVCIKLAAVPLIFWLLSFAEEVPALVLGLIIAVVDIAAFGEFYVKSWCLPDYVGFPPSGTLLGLAAVTSFIAALLMLSQRNLKRLLVLSTIEDVGFLLLGVFSLKTLGYNGAIFAAATHSLAKALLFICLSGPEADGALEGEPKSLAARYPVAAFGFLFGMLAMLGIPPTMGFLGRWRLYETALQIGWPLAAIFILSSIFALIAYVLALTRYWWGPPDDANPPAVDEHPMKEPFILQSVIVVLVVLILAAGIWPDLLQKLLGGRL